MSVLLWWLPPLIATLVAAAWVWWTSRAGTTQQGRVTSPKQLRKLQVALDKELPGQKSLNLPSPQTHEAVRTQRPVQTQETVPATTGAAVGE